VKTIEPNCAISDAEWKVMKVLWDKAPQPAYDIIQQLAKTESWHVSTVKTLLARLCRKEVLGIRRYKNLYLYCPLVTEDDCLKAESESFLERFFGGSVQTLLLHFVRREKLTKKELEELKKLLEQSKKS
jgi:BlaI family transcriptional regulator, penicillinase repressor